MGHQLLSGIFSCLFFTHPPSACISDLFFLYLSRIPSRLGVLHWLFSFLFLYHHWVISDKVIGVHLCIAVRTNNHSHTFAWCSPFLFSSSLHLLLPTPPCLQTQLLGENRNELFRQTGDAFSRIERYSPSHICFLILSFTDLLRELKTSRTQLLRNVAE